DGVGAPARHPRQRPPGHRRRRPARARLADSRRAGAAPNPIRISMTPTHLRPLARAARMAALAAALALTGCESLLRRTPPPPTPRLIVAVTRILDVDEPSPAYYRRRARLEAMGPELDPVLAQLVTAPDTRDNVRANAVTLLAD